MDHGHFDAPILDHRKLAPVQSIESCPELLPRIRAWFYGDMLTDNSGGFKLKRQLLFIDRLLRFEQARSVACLLLVKIG